MMDQLNIPYVIKLKSAEETFNDLKSGKSDLTLGLAVGYHDEYGLYGKNAVTLFTQSVVTPKSKPVQINDTVHPECGHAEVKARTDQDLPRP